jgi:hypothetical protein
MNLETGLVSLAREEALNILEELHPHTMRIVRDQVVVHTWYSEEQPQRIALYFKDGIVLDVERDSSEYNPS